MNQSKKEKIDMKILRLKNEKIKYKAPSDFLDKQKIKNHLIELGKNLDSKDELLIKNILETFVEKIVVYRDFSQSPNFSTVVYG